MASNILVGMGLDITQFETAANKTEHLERVMAHGFELVDAAIRKIPIAGALYAATIGRLIDESAELVRTNRELARIMDTNVSHSLHGTLTQIDDITAAIEKLNKVSISRSLYDFFVLVQTRGHQDNAKIRDANTNALIEERTELIQKSAELTAKEETSRSALGAGSEVEAERLRLSLDYENKILRAQDEVNKIPKEKREQAVLDRLEQQKAVFKEIYDREKDAIETRFTARQEELNTSVKLAEIQLKGNERDIAAEELKLALRKQQLAEQAGTAEDQVNASKDVKIAQANNELAKHNYELSVKQLGIETKLIEAQVFGQTRLAKQLEIQAHYQIQISEELRRGNVDRAKALAAQQKLAQLQEAIREYELGGRGRAQERADERHSRRTARVVQSRLNERARDQTGGQGGLIPGGLTSGGLRDPIRPIKIQPVTTPPVATETQQFRTELLKLLRGS